MRRNAWIVAVAFLVVFAALAATPAAGVTEPERAEEAQPDCLNPQTVKGKGTFASPLGSSALVPTAEGPASFMFKVRYSERGGPFGSARLVFPAGDIRFRSKDLVDAMLWTEGDDHFDVQADGTVNGEPGYKLFLVGERLDDTVWMIYAVIWNLNEPLPDQMPPYEIAYLTSVGGDFPVEPAEMTRGKIRFGHCS